MLLDWPPLVENRHLGRRRITRERRPGLTTWDDLSNPGRARRFFERRPLPPFHPEATEYDPDNAWWLAELSRLIYRHDVEEARSPLTPTRATFLARAGLAQKAFFHAPKPGTQAYLVEPLAGPRFAALVFRGSEDLRDWITNVRLPLEASPGLPGRVHGGFNGALSAVWPEVDAALDELDVPLFFAGHSLGAALATLAAARRPPRGLYTFGSPRVGDAAFAEALAAQPFYRFVHERDPVASLPPEELGYAHAGEARPLASPPGPEPKSLSAWMQRLLSPPRPLADHAPIHYVRRLAQASEPSSGGSRP